MSNLQPHNLAWAGSQVPMSKRTKKIAFDNTDTDSFTITIERKLSVDPVLGNGSIVLPNPLDTMGEFISIHDVSASGTNTTTVVCTDSFGASRTIDILNAETECLLVFSDGTAYFKVAINE